MILGSLFALVLASTALPSYVSAQQIIFDSAHNATTIIGTWSSGSKNVLTGSGFADPANMSFTYPKTTGISYSFASNGWYESSRYRFVSNGTEPNCITGVVLWVHGTYDLNSNGSIILTPAGDGFQQVQDPCAAVSNFIENYNITELVLNWRIFLDATDGPKLHLFSFDGSPMNPMFQVSTTPTMLPTQLLRNVTSSESSTTTVTTRKRGFFEKRNDAAVGAGALSGWRLGAGLGAAVVACLASLVL